ncbi:MAG: ABC transporter ATP-binding protein [Gloeomargarita sp. SKYG116]|nr:ABC transporter ATP-binding protein [Gloeomargarita sp. SKYG116]MCS7292833.1 ABC transporter ATP-binding protein [Gloeomargarita sp. SKYB120]MDW8178396.1 ABC transporter ATP-binding protein [Gloeomargarita sp. SKYBB_i_bin120]MDW8400177.1 ABC transporter ATP-binding protein [Gloeomargarita sp. SKYGB_i_bin116]
MKAPLIRLVNVSKVYGLGENQVQALQNVSLEIQPGEYCAIMGASGSGKSTAMNIIGCLDRPTTGDYYLQGENVARCSSAQLAHIRNQQIGFVFQQFHLLPQLTALENVMLPLVYAGVPPRERQQRARLALEQVGLGHRLHNKPNQLSGGQQQRVAIARAMVNQPALLLADEPTGALDSRTSQEVMDLFAELHQQGVTIVMVTHEADIARRAERIIWFRDGQVLHDHLRPDDVYQAIRAM